MAADAKPEIIYSTDALKRSTQILTCQLADQGQWEGIN